MRLGAYPAVLEPGSVVAEAYQSTEVSERHRHRFEVNPAMVAQLEHRGLRFVAKDLETRSRMEILERDDHPFFLATQFHPEFLSRPLRPAPLFLGLIRAAHLSSP
jgi:CTP synthase